MAILCVQFADKDTVLDSRGGVGFSPPSAQDTIENKYRYGDYWNIIFQPSGSVLHPDADFPDDSSRSKKGFFQYGSLRRYIDDNSYGLHAIVPYRNWSEASGILNELISDSSEVLHRSYVKLLTLDTTKDSSLSVTYIGERAIKIAIDSLDVAWDSLDVVIIHYAGTNIYSYSKNGTYKGARDTVDFFHIKRAIWTLSDISPGRFFTNFFTLQLEPTTCII